MSKEPEYIFYPITPLYCFSNERIFHLMKKDNRDIEHLKQTRAITKKKE